MRKIDILGIIYSHSKTLRSDTGRLLVSDLFVFLFVPIISGLAVYHFGWQVTLDAVGLSITVFSVFAALLLSVQVTLYSVSLRPLDEPDDPKKRKSFEDVRKSRSILLRELNDNISYLILLSVFYITFLLIIYSAEWNSPAGSGVVCGLYVHFFLTLLMVVKRASIVFSREYEG